MEIAEKMMNWLNEEIEDLTFLKDKKSREYSEAIRIRGCMCEIAAANTKEKLKAELCDNYCKYPSAYRGYEDLLQEKCDSCPLDDL